MPPRLLLLSALLFLAPPAMADGLPAVPSVRLERIPGGKVNVVVDNKVHPIDAAAADILRKALDAADLAAARAELGKLRDALRRSEKSADDVALKAKGVERETKRVKDAESEAQSIEANLGAAQRQLNTGKPMKCEVYDRLAAQVSSLEQALAKANKELARHRLNLVRAKAAHAAALKEGRDATLDAAKLRKSLDARLAKAQAALKAAGI